MVILHPYRHIPNVCFARESSGSLSICYSSRNAKGTLQEIYSVGGFRISGALSNTPSAANIGGAQLLGVVRERAP